MKTTKPESYSADFFNERAAVWDSMVTHDGRKLDTIVGMLEPEKSDAVLDAGCGTGVLSPLLADKCGHVLAVDSAEKMIAEAKRKYAFSNVEFRAVRFEDVSGEFDKIIMYSVFPHFEDKNLAVARAARLLKPGGRLVIAHSQSRARINALHDAPECSLPSVEDFGVMFKAAGLRPTESTDDEEMFAVVGVKE